MEHVAFHEVGHAWAYMLARKPLRYVTIRPRSPGLTGLCQPWKPRRIDDWQSALIASTGPIAEAMWIMDNGGEEDAYLEWDDYLTGAVLAGGHDDLKASLGMLDSADTVKAIREELRSSWAAISQAAELLLAQRTVSGREIFDALASTACRTIASNVSGLSDMRTRRMHSATL